MNKNLKIVLIASLVGILLNVILSFVLSPFATKEEHSPSNGANNLSFKSQIMHMLVHHKQVIFTSSLIVAVLVGLSTFLALKLC